MYLTEFGYDDALIGVTDDGRAVYDYELMVEWLMGTQDWSYEEATECVDYNTLRALPYMGEDAPIIMNRLEDVCIMYTIIRTLPRNGSRVAKTLEKNRTGKIYQILFTGKEETPSLLRSNPQRQREFFSYWKTTDRRTIITQNCTW